MMYMWFTLLFVTPIYIIPVVLGKQQDVKSIAKSKLSLSSNIDRQSYFEIVFDNKCWSFDH